MRIINALLFYSLFCSAVFVYGVGSLQAAEASLARKKIALPWIKSTCCVLASISLAYSFSQLLLLPAGLAELFPLAALLLFAGTSVFFEIIFQLTTKKSSSEFAVPFLTVLLSLNEGESLLEALAIGACCLASYYLLLPFLFTFTNKLSSSKNTDSFGQKTSLFLCMVILMMALFALNISWINAGL
jgi:hypothetical protein